MLDSGGRKAELLTLNTRDVSRSNGRRHGVARQGQRRGWSWPFSFACLTARVLVYWRYGCTGHRSMSPIGAMVGRIVAR